MVHLMKHLQYIGFLAITVILCASTATAKDTDSKPNIVLVVMDNLGYGEVGVYGGGVIRGAATPNIDGIAKEGFRLTNFNVEAECTPSRSALMTGRYGIRTRLQKGKDKPPREIWYGITKWEITLAEMLSQQHYATGIFGKWHIGDTPGRYPTDQGFDEWYGIPRSSDRAYWPDGGTFVKGVAKFTQVMSAKRGEKPKELGVYNRAKRRTIDREITDKAIDFMARKAKEKKPFFVYIPYTQTHDPTEPHPDFKGRTGNGNFADVLAQMDAYVGELLATIDELGLKENTIFIFTSDNGPDYVHNSRGSSGPWRDYMFTPYEGSLRVPFLIRWPGKIPRGRVSNDIVHEIDLFPTIAKWAGGKIPEDRVIDGVDQSDFLSSKVDKSARESIVIYVGNNLFGAKWRNYKILLKGIGSQQEIITYAYPAYYNLITDPKEQDPFENYALDTWIDYPLYQVIEDFEASLKKDAGTPDP